MAIPLGPYLKDEIYRPRLTLYIDILGFTSAVEKSKNDSGQAKRLVGLLENLVSQNTSAKEADESGWLVHLGYRGVRRMSMSDSILVSIDTEFQLIDLRKQGIFSKGFQFNELEDMRYCGPYLRHIPLSSMLRDCARIQISLLEAGFLSRGALTVGPLRQHRGIVIGPAYNEAVCLEKNSNYPAITIGSAVVRDYLESWKLLLAERGRIKELLKTSSRRLDISAQEVWAVASESEKWVHEIQTCVDCIDTIEDQHIFNYLKFGNLENLWSNKAETIAAAAKEMSGWNLSSGDHLKGAKQRRIYERWSWICQELAKQGGATP